MKVYTKIIRVFIIMPLAYNTKEAVSKADFQPLTLKDARSKSGLKCIAPAFETASLFFTRIKYKTLLKTPR